MESEVAIALISFLVAFVTFLGACIKVLHWYLKKQIETTDKDNERRRQDSKDMKDTLAAVGINVANTHRDLMSAVEDNKKAHTITHNKLERLQQKETKR